MNLNLLFMVLISGMIIIMVCFPSIKLFKVDSKKETKKSIIQDDNYEKVKLLLSLENPVEKIQLIIDSLIVDAITTYKIFKVDYEPDKYITDKEIEEIIEYVSEYVSRNMTDTINELINLIIKKENIDDYIKIRIKIYILNIVLDKNKLI